MKGEGGGGRGLARVRSPTVTELCTGWARPAGLAAPTRHFANQRKPPLKNDRTTPRCRLAYLSNIAQGTEGGLWGRRGHTGGGKSKDTTGWQDMTRPNTLGPGKLNRHILSMDRNLSRTRASKILHRFPRSVWTWAGCNTFRGRILTSCPTPLHSRRPSLPHFNLSPFQLISDANEMAQLLRRNVVQAVKVDEDRYLLKFDPTRHEMRDNEDDYMTKDGKLKPKSWEQPTPPRTKRRMGAKGAAAAAASTEGGCGSRGCGSDHAQPAQANA